MLEHNPYLKSPEELDKDFRYELNALHDFSDITESQDRSEIYKNQNGSQNEVNQPDENEIPGTGLNPKTEVLTDRDQDEIIEKEQIKKKSVPF